MRVFYCLSAYISHRLAGLEYMTCLRALGHDLSCNYPELPDRGLVRLETNDERPSLAFLMDAALVEKAARADLFILHEEPYCYDDLFEALPFLRQRPPVVYLPWENEDLPASWRGPLSRVARIWTCSDFSRRAFLQAHARVEVLPHVARRPKVTPAALEWGKNLLRQRGAEGATLFFSVMDGLNPRKNLPALLAAFSLLRRESPAPVRLVLKQYRAAMPLDGYADVINIADMLDQGQMAALHALSHAYVSPHHAEGWGLSLAAAMSLGKTVIATGYSGNMEFMNNRNSLLLPYRLVPVPSEMTEKIPLFSPEMRWADPDLPALVQTMRQVAEGKVPPGLKQEAALVTERFGPDKIRLRLKELLEQSGRPD